MQKELISEISSPLVSFIITTSNHQKEHLVECINSILQLSLNAKEREIILVDDGSDELVASQIKKLLDNLLYLRIPGLGSSMARNYGMYLAKGKYIQFIEGDDYLLQPISMDIKKYSLNLVNKDSRIVLSTLREKAGLTGACLMARNRFLNG